MNYRIAKKDLLSAGGFIKEGTLCKLGQVYKERQFEGEYKNTDIEIELIYGGNKVSTSVKNIEIIK